MRLRLAGFALAVLVVGGVAVVVWPRPYPRALAFLERERTEAYSIAYESPTTKFEQSTYLLSADRFAALNRLIAEDVAAGRLPPERTPPVRIDGDARAIRSFGDVSFLVEGEVPLTPRPPLTAGEGEIRVTVARRSRISTLDRFRGWLYGRKP